LGHVAISIPVLVNTSLTYAASAWISSDTYYRKVYRWVKYENEA
jgi:hypothetical protein